MTQSQNQAEGNPSAITLKRALQHYQVKRLRATYNDLLTSQEYGQLGEFFFTDIYAPRDFTRRNNAFKKLSHFLKDAMGARIYSGVEKLIELNDLSERLDDLVVEKLLALGANETNIEALYATAYRACDNYTERVRQIELTVTSTTFMHGMSRLAAIGWIIRGVKLAAFFIGVGDVMEFLQNGYRAFHSTANIEKFNMIVKERELAHLNRIYQI
ncbi:MAG: hypothetical protein AB1489_10140 [Acidobacteriota bacterium]